MAGFHCTSRKFHSIPPSIPMEIPIKLHTFLPIFWFYRTPHPLGNSNPFCGGSMDILSELCNRSSSTKVQKDNFVWEYL